MKLSNFFEKIDKMDMGDVIKDFYKSDAPQFKGKSKKKRRDMAIAAKLSAEESVDESGCLGKQIKKGKAKKESFKEELDLNDGMIGSPDSFYDEEERKEAYEDLKDALDEFPKGWEQESVMQGICPNCAGTGYQDAEYPEYDDDGEEIEDSAFECDGYGMFGCDEGEMQGASWVDIIRHDERNAERQKAKDNYPGDEAVIDQIAKAVKMLDDPRQMYQYMKADYPFMGMAQRSSLIAKGMKKAGLTNESLNEGEERQMIETATIEWLVNYFEDRVSDMESMEELGTHIYDELSYLDLEDIGLEDAETGGQPIRDYHNGRVIDVLDSGAVIDDVLGRLDLSELEAKDPVFPEIYKDEPFKKQAKEGKSPHKKGSAKYKKHMAAMHAEDVDSDSNEADVSKMLAKALGKPNKWSEMTAPELYAELESSDPDMADVIKLTAKMIYDVKLEENTKDKPSKGDCEPCKGTGYKNGDVKVMKSCPVCDGDGEDPGFGGTKAYEEITLDEDQDFTEEFGILGYSIDEENTFEAEYRGRKVKLNKPMRGDVKKFKVYVKDPKTGNVKKVNFGHGGTSAKRKTMRIRKSNPKARKSFRARHNCDNPGPKTKARYWSCRKW